jgi:hypothetical protein
MDNEKQRRAEVYVIDDENSQVIDVEGIGIFQAKMKKWVAYPRLADQYLGPLTSRLSCVNQPIIRTRNGFSVPCHPPLACL